MAGEVVVCSECGHSSDVHGIEGCEANPSYLRPGTMACPCPLHEEDILPMTPEQLAEFDRNRYRTGIVTDDYVERPCGACGGAGCDVCGEWRTLEGVASTNPSTLHMDGTSPVMVKVQATTDELRALHRKRVRLVVVDDA